jgi:hypothetical protein
MFYTTGGCLMCDEAWIAVTGTAPFFGITVTKVDVRDDPATDAAFSERVPVLVSRSKAMLEGPMSRRAVAVAMLRMWFRR